MRLIGYLDSEPVAHRFCDVLLARGIESECESEEGGRMEVWVLDDDRVSEATGVLMRFCADPAAPEFNGSEQRAAEQRRRAQEEERSRKSSVVDAARLGYERGFAGMGYLTLILILLSGALCLFSSMGENSRVLAPFTVSNYYRDDAGISYHLPSLRERGEEAGGEAIRADLPFLPELRKGQVWRLVTPIFIHFGLLHLLFNSMLLRDLGSLIEMRFGSVYFGGLVLALAVGSNLGQAFWSSPNFGGMSGVDYGLFGFLWIRGRCDRFATWRIPSNTVFMLLGWFVLCLVGIIPNVANAAHAVGLGLGMAWGYISSKR
jgi:GlpG protein